jgi:acetoacetate decarboxylase
MSQLRFVKSPEELQAAAENNLEFFEANMVAVKAFYRTEPGLIEKLIPAPLTPTDDPMVRIVVSKVFVDLNGGMDFGAATFGVTCNYQGKPGIYEITMPMEGEGVVVGGRETYGEPKKIANVDASSDGASCVGTVERHGITYIELKGKLGEELPTDDFTDEVYCFKVFPSCEQFKPCDQNPLLVRINMHRTLSKNIKLDGEIILRESPVDPVVDLPVKEIVSLTWEEGTSASNASVVEEVDIMNYVPFMHSRYDSA